MAKYVSLWEDNGMDNKTGQAAQEGRGRTGRAGASGAKGAGGGTRGAGGGAKGAGAKGASGKRRGALVALAAAVLLAAGAAWYYFYAEGQRYFVTDNAKVTANMYALAPTAAGKLVRYTIKAGSFVEEDEIVGRIENGPYLRSPVRGTVVKSNASNNQFVSPSEAVAIVADTGNICITANVEETDIAKIKAGQGVVVALDAYPGRQFRGYVSDVGLTTQNALTGNLTSFSTSGTYTKTTQLLPVKIAFYDDVRLEEIIGTNATVKILVI